MKIREKSESFLIPSPTACHCPQPMFWNPFRESDQGRKGPRKGRGEIFLHFFRCHLAVGLSPMVGSQYKCCLILDASVGYMGILHSAWSLAVHFANWPLLMSILSTLPGHMAAHSTETFLLDSTSTRSPFKFTLDRLHLL